MSLKNVLGVIPARYASTRLPGKPLAKILGKPMVEWVYRSAQKALGRVVVATDDQRIVRAVENFGGRAIMTPASCSSGTERMAYVARKIHAGYYVNIQGDEPLMNPATIREAVSLALKRRAIATAATTLDKKDENNPSAVKVVLDGTRRALYFSRSMIPHTAHGVKKAPPALKHLGLYVYPAAALKKFVKLKPSPLERTEKLEQLKALYHGLPIYVAYTKYDSVGVDTPADLKKVQRFLKKRMK